MGAQRQPVALEHATARLFDALAVEPDLCGGGVVLIAHEHASVADAAIWAVRTARRARFDAAGPARFPLHHAPPGAAAGELVRRAHAGELVLVPWGAPDLATALHEFWSPLPTGLCVNGRTAVAELRLAVHLSPRATPSLYYADGFTLRDAELAGYGARLARARGARVTLADIVVRLAGVVTALGERAQRQQWSVERFRTAYPLQVMSQAEPDFNVSNVFSAAGFALRYVEGQGFEIHAPHGERVVVPNWEHVRLLERALRGGPVHALGDAGARVRYARDAIEIASPEPTRWTFAQAARLAAFIRRVDSARH